MTTNKVKTKTVANEPEMPQEFNDVLKRMLSTPPKPHKKPEKPAEPAKKVEKKKTAK